MLTGPLGWAFAAFAAGSVYQNHLMLAGVLGSFSALLLLATLGCSMLAANSQWGQSKSGQHNAP